MINPFNYVPMEYKDSGNWYHSKSFNKWDIKVFESNYKREVMRPTFLVDKYLYQRIERFTTPIPEMREYNLERIKIDNQIISKVNPNDIQKDSLGVYVTDRYKALFKKVKLEWKNRLSAGDGQMIFQFNGRTGIFKSGHVRQIAIAANELTGEASEQSYSKITWFKYFFSTIPKYYFLKISCAIHNFKYRKEIEEEYQKQKKISDKWFDEVFKDIKQ